MLDDLFDSMILESSPQLDLSGTLAAAFPLLKPGGHILVQSPLNGSSAFAVEACGFAIRDMLVCLRDRTQEVETFLASLSDEQKDLFRGVEGFLLNPKPATELWVLARKPLQEKNVAEQVLKTGTGAINIDGCRIPHTTVNGGSLDTNPHLRGLMLVGKNILPYGVTPKDILLATHPGGRWPANLVLLHGSECEQGHASDDGTDAIDAWNCSPGCPVRTLNEQSGLLSSHPFSITPEMASMGYHGGTGSSRAGPGDSGGASRFFNQFPSKADLRAHLIRLVTSPNGKVLDLNTLEAVK